MVKFSIDDPEFDMNTYLGRIKSFFKSCNPLNAFKSNESILKMKSLLDQ